MTKQHSIVKVYESGCGKWVQIHEGQLRYVSDSTAATVYTPELLKQASQWFEDFLLYRETLFAVPLGSNCLPEESPTVGTYLAEWQAARE